MDLAAFKPATGEADEAFEDWREAFADMLASPADERLLARSMERFRTLFNTEVRAYRD